MTNDRNNDWQYLMEQYLANSISREELERLLQKTVRGEDEEIFTTFLKEYWEKAREKNDGGRVDWDTMFETILEEGKEKTPVVRMPVKNRKNLLYRIAAAVILLPIIGAGIYFLFFNNYKQGIASANTKEAKFNNDLLPGTKGAILTLANGKQIVLDSAVNGTLAVQGTTKVINKDGEIMYDNKDVTANQLLYNTMTIPKGRQFQLVLADGSKVWLNAASSIRYPAAFAGKDRKVEITGEAYFEIAHNADKPFKVLVNGMEIQVLGTHFNVNAYNDEATINTTLLEGSVKISAAQPQTINYKPVTLKPGQQAQINNSPLGNRDTRVKDDVDMDIVMGWKEGYFAFRETDLGTVMRQIARWYDVEIVYEGKIPDRRFGGEISRNSNASQVLKILEESKVKFKIEGKKIIVQP